MRFIVVGYYTKNTLYEKEVKRLINSLRRFNLPYHIEAIESIGPWIANVNYKPKFCKKMLESYNKPILYLDSDAVVRKYPKLFDIIDCDIAIHYRNGVELLTGTLYFNNTSPARRIIEEWIKQVEKNPSDPDQINLAKVLPRLEGINVFILPPNYCQIYDIMRSAGKPVIEHFQASRRYKHNIPRSKELFNRFKSFSQSILSNQLSFRSKVHLLLNILNSFKKRYIV
jgi:hypothetical protein